MKPFDMKNERDDTNDVYISTKGSFMYPNFEVFGDHQDTPCIFTWTIACDESFQIFITPKGANTMYISDGCFMYVL